MEEPTNSRPLLDPATPRGYRPSFDYLLLLCAALLMMLRHPLLLLRGRVYAEEGTAYLRFAWESTWGHAIIATHQGYFSLVPNVVSLLAARVVPLSAAALLFPWSAFMLQVLTAWVVMRSDAFRTHRAKFGAVLVVILTPPSSEIWLSTVSVQFYLAVCTAVLVVSRPRPYHLAVLLLAGLDGVVSCFLLPFFWLRVLKDRTRAVWTQALCLSACTFLQLTLVLRAGLRHVNHDFSSLAEACADKNVLLTFLTSLAAKWYGNYAFAHARAALIPAILLLAGLAALLSQALPARERPAVLLVLMGLWGEACALFFGLDAGHGIVQPASNSRYFFFCNVCIGFALLLGWNASLHQRRRRLLSGCLLVAMFFSGLLSFVGTRRTAVPEPDWQSEVRLWKQDPHRPIHISPATWPPVYLSKDHPNLNLPDDLYDGTRTLRYKTAASDGSQKQPAN